MQGAMNFETEAVHEARFIIWQNCAVTQEMDDFRSKKIIHSIALIYGNDKP